MPPKRKAGKAGGGKSEKRAKRAPEEEEEEEKGGSGKDTEEDSSATEDGSSGADAGEKCAAPPNWKIVSWNVNGIRAWLGKKGNEYIRKSSPDVMVLQETKCGEKDIPKECANVPGYHAYWNSTTGKEGYAGVGLYSKSKPLAVTFGMGIKEHDEEGRMVTAEFEKFYLIGAYVPNSGRGLPRLKYRQKWDKDFLAYIKGLDGKKPVVYTGDLNVAHKEIDLANPKTNTKTAGFTKEERADFTELLANGFTDSFRRLYPKKTAAYSFWSYMGNARGKNIGWRLDYFVISRRLEQHLCDSEINSEVQGSDHCPITLLLNI